jgi:putative endonuclease
MTFYYIYVLKSISKNFIYIGFTLNIKNRLSDHNSLNVTSTKDFAPLELIHYEAYRNKKDAIRREKYLKSTKGKTTLRTMLKEYFSKAVLEGNN